MIDVRFVPLSEFPRKRTPAHLRKKGPFSIAYAKVLDSLEREINHLKGKDTIIEAGFQREHIRMDGWPYASAPVPRDPGVIVSFTSLHGPLRLPCDHFKEWRDNLRAIALHLEHLRLASIYGVGEYGEQYKGWLRLGAGAPAEVGGMTVERAAQFIASDRVLWGQVVAFKEVYLAQYRITAAQAHPDRGGPRERWDCVQRAKAVLDAHHGITKNAGGAT
jgi:hypothetical protein